MLLRRGLACFALGTLVGCGGGTDPDGPVGDPNIVMVSDDFSPEEELLEPWRLHDPVGDTEMVATGSNLELTLPDGSQHDLWQAEGNQAPRVLQPAPDADFGIEIKLESVLELGITMQGIIVQETDDAFLRFGTYTDGSGHSLFAAYVGPEGAEALIDQPVESSRMFLRVERAGDTWTYSSAGEDGDFAVVVEFERPFIPTEAGFYVGNVGESPEFTGSFDYFSNLDDPVDDTDERIVTLPPPPEPVAFWLGAEQDFGPGLGQQWLNILGKVYDEEGVELVTYSLNGAAAVETTVGPDGFRLFNEGDFNIELDPANLMVGANTLELTMEDAVGDTVTESVTINYADGAGPTLPLLADWSEATQISEFGQVIDGHWELQDGGVRTIEPGYDRLIAIGDHTWGPNMEATASFTLHDYVDSGDLSGIGFAFGWQGHEGDATPKLEWPLEALCWVRGFPWDSAFQIVTYPETVRTEEARPEIMLDVEYMLKARSEPLGGAMSRIRAKLWPASENEPGAWDLQTDVPERGGSLLLVSHLVDVTWGDVDIQPVP